MKKVIIILVFIKILGLGYFYFFNKANVAIQQEEVIDTIPIKEVKQTKEVRVGNMVIDVPAELEIIKDTDNRITLKIPGTFSETIDVNKNIKNNDKELIFYWYKDDNLERYSLEEWSMYKGPQQYKWSQIADEEKYIKISSISAYLTQYLAREEGADFEYYNREQTYLSNKTDIYEIWNYRKSETQYPKLTKKEQESIDNYEKIVDEIIGSIRFVE